MIYNHTVKLLMLGVGCKAINLYVCIPVQTLGLQVEPDPGVSFQILIQIRYFAYSCITVSRFSQSKQVFRVKCNALT